MGPPRPEPRAPRNRRLLWIAIGVLALVLAVLAGVLILAVGRDDPSVGGGNNGPGVQYPDQGKDAPGPGRAAEGQVQLRPPDERPTLPDPVLRDGVRLTQDQELQALEQGNVVVFFDAARIGRGLRKLQRRLTGPYLAAVGAAGGALILDRRAGHQGRDRRVLAAPAHGQVAQRPAAAGLRQLLDRARRRPIAIIVAWQPRSASPWPRSTPPSATSPATWPRSRSTSRAPASQGAELVVFPELAVTGYPPEDLLLKEHFLADARAAVERLAAETKDIVALVGFPERAEDVYNAAAVLAGGEVRGDLPQDLPAQLRRLRRGALLPVRRPRRRSSRSTTPSSA